MYFLIFIWTFGPFSLSFKDFTYCWDINALCVLQTLSPNFPVVFSLCGATFFFLNHAF